MTAVVLARGLGIEDFGRYSLAWLIVLIIQSIHYSAVIAPMMSIGPKLESDDAGAYYGGVLAQHFIFNVTSALATWAGVKVLAIWLSDSAIGPLALPIAAAVFFAQSQDFIRRYFFSHRQQRKSFASDATRYVSQLVMLILLFRQHSIDTSLANVFWVHCVTGAAGIVVVIYFMEPMRFRLASFESSVVRNWRSSRWLVSSIAVGLLSGNLFFIAAGAMLGTAAVGALKAAQNLIGITHVLYLGYENFVPYSAARHLDRGGRIALRRYLARAFLFGTLATALVGLILASFPEFWIHTFFGEEYVDYSGLVRWYAILYLTNFLGQTLAIGLRTLEKTAPIFVANLIAAVVSILIAYPLLEHFRATGAVVGMLIAQLASQSFLWWSFRREIRGAD